MRSDIVVRSAGATHVGLVRSHNEDAFLRRDDAGLWAVADGMGGHARGEVASAAVIRALAAVPVTLGPRPRLDAVEHALASAHETLSIDGERRGLSGTTVVALLISANYYACVWAGDSRLYRLRRGELQQLTRDHSMVQEMVDRGEVRREEVDQHPLRNRITSAIGAGMSYRQEILGARVEARDRFLLCSDGLTVCVDDVKLRDVLANGPADVVARRLIDIALQHGAPDNVTAVVVDVVDASDTHALF